jgi:hypothetical protein
MVRLYCSLQFGFDTVGVKVGAMSAEWTKRLRVASRLMYFVFVLNFVTFAALAAYLGGDAVNGKVEGGHYFLFGVRTEFGNKVYTEVSERVFNYSKWHVYFLWLTGLLTITTSIAYNRIKKRSMGKF